MNHFQVSAVKCSICGSSGTNRTTCPCNPNVTEPNYNKHPNWIKICMRGVKPSTNRDSQQPVPKMPTPKVPMLKIPNIPHKWPFFNFEKKIIHEFTEGSCGSLAIAFNRLYGFDIYGIYNNDVPNPVPMHYVIKIDQYYVDITGLYDEAKVIPNTYHIFKITGRYPDLKESDLSIQLVSPIDLDNPDYVNDIYSQSSPESPSDEYLLSFLYAKRMMEIILGNTSPNN
jgi:hypothetical protein